jgi:eukaryotic-like serine/threonine-protein kinase
VIGRADAVARFAREAAAAASIRSPHVVQVFDHGVTENGTPYIVMELLDGHDLADHLAEVGRMPPGQVVDLVNQVAKALAKAHRSGVIHRDIKPENIFLCEAEADAGELFVKLLDFGTAKHFFGKDLTETNPGELLGTPYYMSPEQIIGARAVDGRADVWSLGVVTYEALTGVRPFEAPTVGGITLAIHTTSPKMTDAAPDLPAGVDAWFAQACARSPDERFPGAREAADALVEALRPVLPSDSVVVVPQETPAFPRQDTGRWEQPPIRESRHSMTDRAVTDLAATLPTPASQRRPVTIAAGIVFTIAALTMVSIVMNHRTPVPDAAAEPTSATSSQSAEVNQTPNATPPPSAASAPTSRNTGAGSGAGAGSQPRPSASSSVASGSLPPLPPPNARPGGKRSGAHTSPGPHAHPEEDPAGAADPPPPPPNPALPKDSLPVPAPAEGP